MRILSELELDLVTGGDYHGTVYAPFPWDDFQAYFYSMTADYGSNLGSSSAPTPPPPPPPPDCHLTNPVLIGPPEAPIGAPDNAAYYLPENVTQQYLINALNHLSEYSRSHTAAQLLSE